MRVGGMGIADIRKGEGRQSSNSGGGIRAPDLAPRPSSTRLVGLVAAGRPPAGSWATWLAPGDGPARAEGGDNDGENESEQKGQGEQA